MLNHVNRVIVGKPTGSATPNTGQTLATMAAGDILLLDADTNAVIATTAAAAAAKGVIIATMTVGGSIVTSAPIWRSTIKKTTFNTYRAAVQQVDTYTSTGMVADKQYMIIIPFVDEQRLIANRQTRAVIFHTTPATGFVEATEVAKVVAKINADPVAKGLVVASTSGTNLVITGQAVAAKSIDKYEWVRFDSTFNTVTSLGDVTATLAPSSRTEADPGSGKGVQVRELEFDAQSYLGVSDRRDFRRPTPALNAVASVNYDLFHIYHADIHQGDLQEPMSSPLLTTVALYTGGGQLHVTAGAEIADLISSFAEGAAVTAQTNQE